jgi:hypothetical protein
VEYRGRFLNLHCGGVSLKSSGAAVRAATFTFWPAEAEARFRVEITDATLHVTANAGSVWINDGGRDKQALHQGSEVTFVLGPDAFPCDQHATPAAK